jgi:hypothetical protein
MNRIALALAATLVLSFANGTQAFHHWGCGGCGHSVGHCGLHRCGMGGCGGGCGLAHHGCGDQGCGGGYGGCGASVGGCSQGCGAAISDGSAPVYGSYFATPWNAAIVTARTVRNVQTTSIKLPSHGQTLNSRARTLVVDLRSFDLDAPSKQISVAATKSGNGLVVRNDSAK